MSVAAKRRLLIQGATGSIGKSTLDVVREQSEYFEIVGLAARSNSGELLKLAEEFRPHSIALENEPPGGFSERAKRFGVAECFTGDGAAREQAAAEEYDLLVNAMMGNAGMAPTMAALERGISVALANKETLVAAGPIVMSAAKQSRASVIPIDSEHSAILQCMTGEKRSQVRKIWLTTSGGPFWGKSPDGLREITVEQALNHPRWSMGPKITIDSATLLNKGLEVIETQRLFDLPVDRIGIVRHREHIIHSFVEFVDGSFKAQLGVPDMRIPILYALSYPERFESGLVRTDPTTIGALHFEPVDAGQYPCLELAYRALERGGDMPAALCAADEVAVEAFLNRRIAFNDIGQIITDVLDVWNGRDIHELSDVLDADRRARELAAADISRIAGEKGRVAC